ALVAAGKNCYRAPLSSRRVDRARSACCDNSPGVERAAVLPHHRSPRPPAAVLPVHPANGGARRVVTGVSPNPLAYGAPPVALDWVGHGAWGCAVRVRV